VKASLFTAASTSLC